jgi:uncharacterized protein
MLDFAQITGFDWDKGNNRKNDEKHDVSQAEAEQIFFNEPLLLLPDTVHSHAEPRIHALGKTNGERWLHVTFTLKFNNSKIRVISARDMHRKERDIYEQEK